jgi:hypothetical protein
MYPWYASRIGWKVLVEYPMIASTSLPATSRREAEG